MVHISLPSPDNTRPPSLTVVIPPPLFRNSVTKMYFYSLVLSSVNRL